MTEVPQEEDSEKQRPKYIKPRASVANITTVSRLQTMFDLLVVAQRTNPTAADIEDLNIRITASSTVLCRQFHIRIVC